ncbi:MAG TPA: hypothetical protein VGO56_12865 [Pyrinomonadaceae bacterium]|jgi:hypothetical protein|nr:hypothetical protein [Pyrinomonadaceae bacterium]
MTETTKVDMSEAAITERLKRAGGLSDSERQAIVIRNLVAEIKSEEEASVKSKKEKKGKDARFRS